VAPRAGDIRPVATTPPGVLGPQTGRGSARKVARHASPGTGPGGRSAATTPTGLGTVAGPVPVSPPRVVSDPVTGRRSASAGPTIAGRQVAHRLPTSARTRQDVLLDPDGPRTAGRLDQLVRTGPVQRPLCGLTVPINPGVAQTPAGQPLTVGPSGNLGHRASGGSPVVRPDRRLRAPAVTMSDTARAAGAVTPAVTMSDTARAAGAVTPAVTMTGTARATVALTRGATVAAMADATMADAAEAAKAATAGATAPTLRAAPAVRPGLRRTGTAAAADPTAAADQRRGPQAMTAGSRATATVGQPAAGAAE
jgi:hypothetical protein